MPENIKLFKSLKGAVEMKDSSVKELYDQAALSKSECVNHYF